LEYLQNDDLREIDEEDNDDNITIYFNFVKYDKKFYLELFPIKIQKGYY